MTAPERRAWGAAVGRQFGDFAAYILLPLLCAVLPLRLGHALLRHAATGGWVLVGRSLHAHSAAARHVRVPDAEAWRVRWRLVELLEARDVWLVMLGRGAALARTVRVDGPWPRVPPDAWLGLHWGPSALALDLLRRNGQQPRFVHRAVQAAEHRHTPFFLAWLKLLVAYIQRCCARRAITVPGARRALEDALQGGSTPVLLVDAPVTRAEDAVALRLGNRPARVHRAGFDLLAASGSQCRFYLLGLDPDGAGRTLRLGPPVDAADGDALRAEAARWFDRALAADSAQWRLWHAADQLWDGFGEPAADQKLGFSGEAS